MMALATSVRLQMLYSSGAEVMQPGALVLLPHMPLETKVASVPARHTQSQEARWADIQQAASPP